MIQNALHILGPVSAMHLDPFLLVDSQPKGVGGYVMICPNDRRVSGEYHLLYFDGEGSVDCVRLTAEGRSFVGIDIARAEYGLREKGRVMVHLFTIDSSPMEKFVATVRNDPCFKIRVDSLRRKQVEMLVRAYGSREVLAERNDFMSDPPQMEFHSMIPGQPLPTFAMGFGRGEFLLYRCPEAEGLSNAATTPNRLPRVSEEGRPESTPTGIHRALTAVSADVEPNMVCPGLPRPESVPTGVHRALTAASADVEANRVCPGLPRPESAQRGVHPTPVPTVRSAGPEGVQPGAHVTPGGAFVDGVRDALRPGSARANRAAKSGELPDQLEFLPGSKGEGNAASSATASPRGSAPVPEIVKLLQQLVDEFRRQTMSILGSKGVLVFESCELQLRKQMPHFRSDEIVEDTALLAIDLIDAVVRAAPLLKRSKVRNVTLALIADLYNKHFEVLNRCGIIPRIEEVYFSHKK